MVLKEIAKIKDFSFNVGGNHKYIGGSIGYTPPVLYRSFEVHGGVFNSWEDTFSGQFKPKIGIGVSAKF